MAQDTTPSMIIYQGDGSNNVFSIPFDKGYYGAISVAFVRRGLTEYEYNPTTYSVSGFYYAWSSNGTTVYTNTTIPSIGSVIFNARGEDTGNVVSFVGGSVITVNGVNYARTKPSDINHNALLTWTGDVLNVGDFICIVRNTELGQPFVYPNNQKHIEDALDNLERQIQEVKSADGFALHVDPSYETDPNKMNPIDWLQTIIRSKDLSVRAFRFLNGWLDYSFDDPEKADADKEWFHLLNTDNIISVREMHDIDEEGKDIYWTEYQDQYGEWKTLSNAPLWEKQLDEIQETADNALAVAEEAKTIAGNAEVKSDLAISKSESAFSMATESLAKSDTALANSEYAVETSDTANAKSDVAVATSARAEDKSDTAVATSARAETKAEQAVTTSQEALAGVQSAVEAAERAIEAAERAEQEIQTYDGRITEAQNNASEALSQVGNKQDQLVSGVNIKTVNDQSILGEGNIEIKGGVESVNTKTGVVVLTGEDIAADVSELTDTIQGHLQTLHDNIKDIELFKFPNATIIGEPIIDHGQVSGFTANDYLQFPFIVDLHNQQFVIDFCFTTGNDVTTQQNILDSQFGLALAIANGKGLMAISHNGTSWAGSVVGTLAIQPNTTYYARLSWNRINYKTELSTDGKTYVSDMNFGSTQSPYPRTMFIGGCSGSAIGHTPHPFGGTINMNYAYLTVAGNVIWQGMDDAGLSTRADISLDNLDEFGQAKFDAKQNKLIAGTGITIENDVISSTGGTVVIIRDL